jgi:hypothetical protein
MPLTQLKLLILAGIPVTAQRVAVQCGSPCSSGIFEPLEHTHDRAATTQLRRNQASAICAWLTPRCTATALAVTQVTSRGPGTCSSSRGSVAQCVAFGSASAAPCSRARKVSINARTRAGMCARVGKTAHIPTSSGLTSARTMRCNSPRSICSCTSQ